MGQHPARGTRPQQINMVDMGTAHQHRRRTRPGFAPPTRPPKRTVPSTKS